MSPAVFSHGDLRLYLLSILAEGPQHGYGLMKALSDRTGGTYVPSAGTIYPRLAQLEEEGLVTKRTEGRRSIYEITDAGREEVTAREEELGPIETGLNDSVRQIAEQVRASVSEAMSALKAEFAAAKTSASSNASTGPSDAADPPPRQPKAEAISSRANLARAEVALANFRTQARTIVRTRVAQGGTYTAAEVARLEAGLKQLLEELSVS